MALSRRSSIILQFTLIICISAIIAGLAGGLTSKVSKWSAEVEGKEEAMGNVTMRMEEKQFEIRFPDHLLGEYRTLQRLINFIATAQEEAS